MPRVIANEFYAFGASGGAGVKVTSERGLKTRVLRMGVKKFVRNNSEKKNVSSKIKPVALLVFLALILGFSYLYQVNDLATKGFEIRDLEKKIQELEKDSKKMQIREVELRSMYSIEKSTGDLNPVGPENITYVDMDGPLAMK